jgi:hypothetical protein
MVIRIRFGRGPKVGKKSPSQRRIALAFSALLTPAAVMAFALGCWRLAADLNLAGSFAISTGLFSHWQVWLGGAAALQLCAHVLTRYGRNGDTAAS